MSIQLTIHRNHLLVRNLSDYLSSLVLHPSSDIETSLKTFLDLESTFEPLPFEFQEVNKCYLIYQGLNHLFTIKFEL